MGATGTGRLANNITMIRPALTNLANWYGVKLDSSGFVVSLTLRSNRLRGRLPESLGLLSRLEYCDLYNNSLCGPVPSSVAKLTKLKDLYLTENRALDIPSRAELQSLLPKCRLRI